MGNQRNDDWDDEEPQQTNESSEQRDQSSRNSESCDGNGGTDVDVDFQQPEKDEFAPGTEEQSFDEAPSNQPQESFEDQPAETNVDQSSAGDDNGGNTTPLCDEAETKE